MGINGRIWIISIFIKVLQPKRAKGISELSSGPSPEMKTNCPTALTRDQWRQGLQPARSACSPNTRVPENSIYLGSAAVNVVGCGKFAFDEAVLFPGEKIMKIYGTILETVSLQLRRKTSCYWLKLIQNAFGIQRNILFIAQK